ncbi:hypothetical protein NBRC116188_00160 [Oceaniserpentilla sp. 4NH20-0058]|uniref:DUF695 domain-containing protein n=1 Tax=Oceaniserpentilla sp. 4NH20-0058 TaxID=3127660 RepID=UPI00310A2635
MAFSNRWVLADGTLNDEPITIRYRDELESEQANGAYAQCVQISWTAAEVDEETGYPSENELLKIDGFNQKLMAAIEPNEQALVVMVIMCQGINQWILYCKDTSQLQSDLNTIPTDTGLYPIEIVAEEDTQWTIFTQLRDAIKTQ